ncbi:MAG: insulinase family protein [Sphingomonadales bacterium]|jgi:zinc protease|nr:insulinase family protein [Sphingomonadales bacterium]MBK9268285.1 insulinase family protein [Sphingomonadales bacterium]MBP6435252.1 insulinase family protein [Sphingorhabdus sp.]
MKLLHSLRVATALALLLPAQAAFAETTAVTETKAVQTPWLYENSDVPVDASWTFGVLENGLRYAVKKNVVPAGQVSIRVRVDAGALHEEDNELGFAHLMEHLAFRGSEHVPDGEAKRIWQRFGVSFGSDSNAQTTPTQTVYKLDLPNASPASLDESLKLLAGMVRAPNVSESALNAERAIVQAELRESAGAGMDLGEAMRRHAFQGQRLANRSTIGTIESLNSASAAGLSEFHRRWYRPEKVVVSIAGDADPKELERLVRLHFGGWKAKGAAVADPDFGRPDPKGTVARTVVEPTLPPNVAMIYARPWEKVADTIVYNEQLLVDALAQQIVNRRLVAQARAGSTFSLAEVAQEDISRSADTTTVIITPIGDNWQQAVRDVRAIIEDAVTTPPSQADIDRELALFGNALRTMRDSYPFEAAAKQADDIVKAVDIRETIAAPETVVAVYENMRDKFTSERLLAATQALFAADAIRILRTAPAVDGADADVRLAKALTDPVVAAASARLAENAIGFDDLPKLGTPAQVVVRNPMPRFEMESVELSNGVRALLFPNKSESGQVRVLVRFGRGYQAMEPAKAKLFWSGPGVISESGIAQFGRTQIDQLINGRRIELGFNVDNDAFEYAATTRPEDLADQLRLIATKMENPNWDSAPLEREKALAISGYRSFDMSAAAVLQRELQYRLSGNDPRWKIPTPDEVRKLDSKAFRSFWEPLLASGPVEVLLFGDFDAASAVQALQATVGAMQPRPAVPVAEKATRVTFPPGNAKPLRFTHKGPQDQMAAVIGWPTGAGLAAIGEGRQLEILAALFRDRLFEKFRAEQAASYSPDATATWPDEFAAGGFLMAYGQMQPKDKDRFFAFAQSVAADLAATPVGKDELQRALEPILQYVERATTGNLFWMNELEGATYNAARYEALGRLYSDYSKVTPEQLQALARKYLVAAKAWTMVVEPEPGAVASR